MMPRILSPRLVEEWSEFLWRSLLRLRRPVAHFPLLLLDIAASSGMASV